MNDPSVIIFDLDGTLLHSAPGIIQSLTHAVRELGHDFQPYAGIQALLGPPMNAIVAQLLSPFGDDRVAQGVAIYRDHYREHGLYNCAPYPGIGDALQALSARGHRLCVATSKRQAFAEKMLHHTGLYPAFEKVYGTSADGKLDDKADLLQLLHASLHLDPRHSLMIGDKRDDMIAARTHGVVAMGVTWGYGSATELLQSGAATLVHSPDELPDGITGLTRDND